MGTVPVPNGMVIVQARMGSSRLPGKVAKPFGASTLLQHIVRRLMRSELGDRICVATTAEPEDDHVEELARSEGVRVFRGATDDVLGRFVACLDATKPEPEFVVRVCADRPFVCPLLVDELVDVYEESDNPDYVSNNLPRSYPNGLDLELVRTEALRSAHASSASSEEREHVTPFVYRRPDDFRLVNSPCPYGDFSAIRAVVDTAADYAALEEAHRRLEARRRAYDHRDVLNLATISPEAFPTPL